MNSELLEASFEKHTSDAPFSIKGDGSKNFASLRIEGEEFVC
jgi:hypothetical protein